MTIDRGPLVSVQFKIAPLRKRWRVTVFARVAGSATHSSTVLGSWSSRADARAACDEIFFEAKLAAKWSPVKARYVRMRNVG